MGVGSTNSDSTKNLARTGLRIAEDEWQRLGSHSMCGSTTDTLRKRLDKFMDGLAR